MSLRKIRVGELPLGQALPWSLYSQRGNLLLPAGSELPQADLAALVELGLYLDPLPLWQQPPQTTLQTVLHLTHRLAELLAAPERCPDLGASLHAMAAQLLQAAASHPDALMASVVLHGGGPLTARHSINCAAVLACVLQAMPQDAEQGRALLCAALSMNIGLHELHEVLASQGSPLSAPQQGVVGHHPLAGVDRLRQLGVNDAAWLRAVIEHHEAVDGSGYPYGLRGQQMGSLAQLLGLADVFCARVAERAYRRAVNARIVLRDLLIERGRRFDALQAAYFIRALGIYPVGTVVLLANGEQGVVSAHGSQVDAPQVHVLRGAHGAYLQPPQPRATDSMATAIVDTVAPGELGCEIDLAAIWGEAARDYPLAATQLAGSLAA